MCSWEWTQQSTKQNTIENNEETKLREEKNWTIEEHSVKPQHWDQSKRLLWHRPINSTKYFSESSKDRWLRSIHTVHIKHPRIKFQISESCFPSQWFQQNNNSATELGKTHWIPKTWSIKTHKEFTTWQWIKRWCIDSPLHRHIQHRFAKGWPLSIRLSNVRMWSWVAVHRKKKPPFWEPFLSKCPSKGR